MSVSAHKVGKFLKGFRPARLKLEVLLAVQNTKTVEELRYHLQNAVMFEHATIPAYLTAYYSVDPRKNAAISSLIRSVLVQEMLHMVIAANILNAIGGTPEINRPGFIPTYPGPLPMMIADGLIVGLEKFSFDLVLNTFMRIEMPEHPQDYPSKGSQKIHLHSEHIVKTHNLRDTDDAYPTVGSFYDAIAKKIVEFGDAIFTGDRSKQVVNNAWYPQTELFAVTNVETALRAIHIIVEQGEGESPDNPMDDQGNPSHFYRFAEIIEGYRLVQDPEPGPDGKPTYSYSGAPIHFDETGVINLKPNSKVDDYPQGSLARQGVELANYSYTSMLNALHHTCNGGAAYLNTAITIMYELRLLIMEQVINQEIGPSGVYAAPSFQFDPAAAAAGVNLVAPPTR